MLLWQAFECLQSYITLYGAFSMNKLMAICRRGSLTIIVHRHQIRDTREAGST